MISLSVSVMVYPSAMGAMTGADSNGRTYDGQMQNQYPTGDQLNDDPTQ
jgi:hypothetical protein